VFQSARVISTSRYAGATAVADLNGDGRPDIVVANMNATVSVFINNGKGKVSRRRDVPTGLVASKGQFIVPTILAGDFEERGVTDIVVVDKSNAGHGLALLSGNGQGGFLGSIRTVLPGPFSLAGAADTNLDGNLNLVSSFAGSSDVLLGRGDGTFSVGAPRTDIAPTLLTDVNGDGIPDAVQADRFLTALGNGDGTFRNVVGGTDQGISIFRGAAGDFNGDGKPDLIVIMGAGDGVAWGFSLFLGRGDGTFSPPAFVSGGGFFYPYSAPVIGDFNGDGKTDLFYTTPMLGKGYVFLAS
jgi:hypothetical protein